MDADRLNDKEVSAHNEYRRVPASSRMRRKKSRVRRKTETTDNFCEDWTK